MIWYVEENKREYPTVIPFHGILLSGMLRKTLESMNCNAAPMWRFLCAKQFENVQVLVAEKKIGVDRPRPSRFRKNFFKESMSKLKNRRGQV